jgi:peptidoglycan glycosyltransferase
MGTEIRRVAAALLAGFLALTGGVIWWQVVRADRLAGRSGNPRVAEISARADRGTIYAIDGAVLAHNERGPDGRNHRTYPVPSLAHALGYVSVRYGVTGLEEALNGYLSGDRGTDAAHVIWADISRSPLRGNDVVLTIDSRIQAAAAAALGDRAGAVVALDPRTGAVLAMVSRPGFDPGAIDEQGAALIKDGSNPLLNRATQGQYPPGSTFKTVTAAAALDSGRYMANAQFKCPSGYVVEGFVIACKGIPPGVREYDFAHAYAWSINATFAEVAVNLGAPELVRYARAFGFEEEIPFDLTLATSHLLRGRESFNNVLLANTGFGQGQLAITPMQMALVVATVANNGLLMEPYLVHQVRSPEGAVLLQHEPKSIRQVIKPETAATLRGFMVTAVREGFSGAAAIPGVEVGGKTGTAEVANGQTTHAWFTSIAPANDARIAVAVIVENAGQGSTVAAPIAQAVMKAALGK